MQAIFLNLFFFEKLYIFRIFFSILYLNFRNCQCRGQKKTGNAGGRVACALIMRPEDANQPEMMTIIIIVLIVIIVLLLILITALIVYCCKRYDFFSPY